MANERTNGTAKKKFNPTITAMFENEKFGQGSLLSANIDAKGYQEVQQHLQVGSKLVLRKSPRPTKNGGVTYFLEILPPFEGNGKTYTKRTASNEDEI